MNSANHQSIRSSKQKDVQHNNKLQATEPSLINDLTTEIMLAYAAEEKSISQAFDQLNNKHLIENYQQSNHSIQKNFIIDKNNNNESVNGVKEKTCLIKKTDVNSTSISINGTTETINDKKTLSSFKQESKLNNKQSTTLNGLINGYTNKTLSPLVEKSESLLLSNNINSIEKAKNILKNNNKVKNTLELSTKYKKTTASDVLMTTTKNSMLEVENNDLNKMSLRDEIEVEHKKLIANSVVYNEKNLTTNATSEKTCASLTDDVLQSSSLSSSFMEIKNEIKTKTITKKLTETVTKVAVVSKPTTMKIASKLAPMSSTLPRKKVMSVANGTLKSISTASSTTASNENISKTLINSNKINKTMSSTINLTTTSNIGLLRRPTPNLKSSSLTLSLKKIENETNNSVKGILNVIKQSDEKKLFPLGKTIAPIRTTTKISTVTNKLTTSVLRNITDNTKAENGQKSLAPLSKSTRALPISSTKALVAKTLKSTNAEINKTMSTFMAIETKKIAENNTNIRSVRGKSSVPRTSPICSAKNFSSIKQKATSTVNLSTKIEYSGNTAQKIQTSGNEISTMCKILKSKLPEVKLDVNSLNGLSSELSTGILLCRFVNKVSPRSIPNILLFQSSQNVCFLLL